LCDIKAFVNYTRLNDVKRPFKALVAICRAKNGELLTNKDQVVSRWKEHFEQPFEQHLNEEEKRDKPPEMMELKSIFQAVKKLKSR
jgi:hypothetical protein